jgi:hypothetical protein
MKVLQGELVETLYAPPLFASNNRFGPDKLQLSNQRTLGENQVAYISGTLQILRFVFIGIVYLHGNEKNRATNDLRFLNLRLDEIGLHRVSNGSTDKPALSLHLYTPPFSTCKTFCERTGASRAASQCVFYSKNGIRCTSTENVSCPNDTPCTQ